MAPGTIVRSPVIADGLAVVYVPASWLQSACAVNVPSGANVMV